MGMEGIWGFNYAGNVMQRTLDALALRQRVVAHNVANVNTPGYIPRQVLFEENLKKALQEDTEFTQHAALAAVKAPKFSISLGEQPGVEARPGGSGVDIDKEMVTLAQTVITYNAITNLTNGLFGRVRTAIKEGGR